MTAYEVQHEIEIFFRRIYLVVGKGFIDLDGTPSALGLDASHRLEVG
jgi:hypothetical protein